MAAPPSSQASEAATAIDAPPAPTTRVIRALTPVRLEVTKALGSKISKAGEIFPLRLAEPIMLDGAVIVPAGAEGVGEVVDAKHSGMSGSAGVLVLAARYLQVKDRRLRLRSMHLSGIGADHRVAAMVTGAAIGVFGLLIQGGESDVAAGSVADAKTAEDFALDPISREGK